MAFIRKLRVESEKARRVWDKDVSDEMREIKRECEAEAQIGHTKVTYDVDIDDMSPERKAYTHKEIEKQCKELGFDTVIVNERTCAFLGSKFLQVKLTWKTAERSTTAPWRRLP